MAQLRPRSSKSETTVKTKSAITKKKAAVSKKPKTVEQTFEATDDDVEAVVKYPTTDKERKEFVNEKTGKQITPFQFRVYDLVRQIPAGHVTSFEVVSNKLKTSPRAVSQALRINPFCPLPVPCHRVINSDYNVGGISGSFDHQLTANKKAKLMKEGCIIDEDYNFKSNADGTNEFFANFKL